MSSSQPPSRAGAARRLWARSPAWRFLVMLAPLLTAVFILFPPGKAPPRTTITADASYTPGPAAQAPEAPSPPAGAQARPPNAAPPAQAPAPAAAPMSKETAAPPPPKTAALSMVTGGPAAPSDGTGLNPALVGNLFSGTFEASGLTVPLPPGRWAVLARMSGKIGGGAAAQYALGRIANGKLSAVLHLTTITGIPTPNGVPEAKTCTQPRMQIVHYVFVDSDSNPLSHQGCWTLENFYTAYMNQWADRAAKMSALDRATAGDLAAKGLSLPQDAVQLRFLKSNASNFVELRVMFSPESEGISSNPAATVMDSDWSVANVARYPEKTAYLARMKAWGASFWPGFAQAFDKSAARAP
jgi:hypothetical protein